MLRSRAQIDGATSHTLRHTFASTLLSRGVPVHVVQALLGHTTPTMTLSVYAHVAPRDHAQAVATLAQALAR